MEQVLCLVGCGGQAFQSYLPALSRCLREDPALRFVGCCNVDPERARRFSAALGQGLAYANLEQMLREAASTAVLVTTPFAVIADIASSLLLCGISMLIEKPLGESTAQALRILEATRAADTRNRVDCNYFDPMRPR